MAHGQHCSVLCLQLPLHLTHPALTVNATTWRRGVVLHMWHATTQRWISLLEVCSMASKGKARQVQPRSWPCAWVRAACTSVSTWQQGQYRWARSVIPELNSAQGEWDYSITRCVVPDSLSPPSLRT